MASDSAISVHDVLATREAGVGCGAAEYEGAAAVDVDFCAVIQPPTHDGAEDFLGEVFPEALAADAPVVLGGEDHGVSTLGLAELILNRDLGLAIGAQVWERCPCAPVPALRRGGVRD